MTSLYTKVHHYFAKVVDIKQLTIIIYLNYVFIH